MVDRVDDRPAPFAGVGHVAAQGGQVVALLLERPLGELAQPRAHDRPAVPQPGDLLEVDVELGAVHELEALGVRLHDPVLHAVVDHLDEVPRAGIAEMPPAVGRRQHVEDRCEALHRLLVAADHHAVADLQAPHTAGRTDVDVVDPALGERRGAADIVVPVRVAAVDDRVALVEQVGELEHRLLGGVARGHHHPHCPRRVERGHELLERGHAGGAVLLRGAHRLRVEVEGDDLMVRVAMDAMDHVAAHLPKPDEAELHQRFSFPTRTASRLCERSVCRSPSAWARMSCANV